MLLKREPKASISYYASVMPFKRVQDLQRYLEGLRKAGLRESASSAAATLE
jgi:hypothetical protein